jgi:hypothetical protein
MRLIPITAKDEDLAVQLECNPVLMRHTGGSRPESDVRLAHQRRFDLMEKGAARMYKVVASDSDEVHDSENLIGLTPQKYKNNKRFLRSPAQNAAYWLQTSKCSIRSQPVRSAPGIYR